MQFDSGTTLTTLPKCNTVTGAGVEGEVVVIDQHGDDDV